MFEKLITIKRIYLEIVRWLKPIATDSGGAKDRLFNALTTAYPNYDKTVNGPIAATIFAT